MISLAQFWDDLTQDEKTTIYMLVNRKTGPAMDYADLPFANLGSVFEAIGNGQPYDFLSLPDRQAVQRAERVFDPALGLIKATFREKGQQNQQKLLIKLGWNDRSIPTSKIFG